MSQIKSTITANDLQMNTLRSWCVVLAASLYFFYIFIQMNLFNAINNSLIGELNFDAKQISLLFAAYSYGNVLFLFPAGMLLDRLSVRTILLIVFAISIIATYVFSVTSSFWMMGLARFVIGLAGAFVFISVVKLASRWFEPRYMALVIGVAVTLAMFGGAIAQTPLAILTQKLGWRSAMQFVVALGVFLLVVQLPIVKDESEGYKKLLKEAANSPQPHEIGLWRSLQRALVNKQNWLSGVYISLVNLPLFILGGIWGAPYLTQVHKFSHIQATSITTMLFVGMMIGAPLSGWISDRISLRKLPMIVGALATTLIMIAVMFAPTMSFAVEASLYFIFGFMMGFQVIGYPVITESNPPSITATATSVGSTLIMAGGMLVPIFGWLLEMSSDMKIVEGMVVYSSADFTRANCLMLLGLVIASVAACLIKETHCKHLS